jgi:hypothetical protein
MPSEPVGNSTELLRTGNELIRSNDPEAPLASELLSKTNHYDTDEPDTATPLFTTELTSSANRHRDRATIMTTSRRPTQNVDSTSDRTRRRCTHAD